MPAKICVLVATHKKYRMPKEEIYLPIHVGHEGKADIGFIGDDTGENISSRNATLCELTGIYWAWKNLDADYIGLVHYRRYFTKRSWLSRINKDKFECVLTGEELLPILEKYDMVLPKQRKYYIESLLSHFLHLPYAHEKDVDVLRSVIAEVQPEYLQAYDDVMSRTHAHMFNMFIMKRADFERYCEWIFSILLEVDRRIDTKGYTPMEARAAAYFGEFLIDVWNEKQHLSYCELPVMFMEKQSWLRKGGSFLLRKISRKKTAH